MRTLLTENRVTPAVAAHALTCVLQALQTHGQHDSNLGSLLMLGTQLYEMLRPRFALIKEVCILLLLCFCYTLNVYYVHMK